MALKIYEKRTETYSKTILIERETDPSEPENPENPVDPTPEVDPFATEPDKTDHRTSNGDIILPYRYTKNGWDVIFDLDITDKISKGLFNLPITPITTPTGEMPEAKLVLQKGVAGKTALNIYDAQKKTFLALGQTTILDLKFNFTERKIEYTPGNWGDNETYLYLFVNGHCSGVFYIFPTDAGAKYIRQ